MSRQNLLLILLLGFISLNFLGTFVPETGFDALWYHLTLPKLYLENGNFSHIPGGLLYYSEMPRLTEVLYLFFWPHLVNFLFGLGTILVLYKFSRRYLDKLQSLTTVLIFYGTPLVSWLSTSAYIDLPRTFWELLAAYFFFGENYVLSALVLGLAISTKTLALGSLAIYNVLFLFRKVSPRHILLFNLLVLLVCSPWFLSAFLNTGNPIYPLGSAILDSNHSSLFQIFHPWTFGADFLRLAIFPEDPFTPFYLLILPFVFTLWRKYSSFLIYCFIAYTLWWLTPRTGGSRFILPYLPMFALTSILALSHLKNKVYLRILSISLIILLLLNFSYRSLALFRAAKFLSGRESAQDYLCSHIDFTLGTYVDCDSQVAKIVGSESVLVSGVHNLYYLDVPFVHESWYRGQPVDYLLTQNETTASGMLIYSNSHTGVKLYKL